MAKQRFTGEHQDLLNERFNACITPNGGIEMDDLKQLNHATYYMGTDNGYDNCLDEFEKVGGIIAGCGAIITAGVAINKVIKAKLYK